MFFTSLFSSNLITKKLAKDIQYITTTDSTNDTIWKMFCDNEIKPGGVLIAEQQNKGRGRRGKIWYSSSGESLTFSFLINSDIISLEIISLSCGIAIVNGIKEFTGLECNLKWPNDIMFDNNKIGGILIEQKKDFLIIGIGINVNNSDFNPKIKDNATSLRKILNHTIQREPLLAYIFNHIDQLLNCENNTIIKTWISMCNHINKNINFHDSANKILKAKFLTINNQGEAILNINGEKQIIQSGFIE